MGIAKAENGVEDEAQKGQAQTEAGFLAKGAGHIGADQNRNDQADQRKEQEKKPPQGSVDDHALWAGRPKVFVPASKRATGKAARLEVHRREQRPLDQGVDLG